MFQKIDLHTRDGQPIAKALCPPFPTPPMVLIWGERYFGRRADGLYYEVDSCPVFTEEELEVGRKTGALT